ncbi:MAG: type transport system ATP-binding protein [Actinomycetota bacterium]|jgi:ABC-2 type transport system ATP-binding protein|nr:type transport system ATP-binding protein [Actinomycetota bacterium]MDX6442905.1 type transport system ATP-binding protein [Gaiellaceae bacterium]
MPVVQAVDVQEIRRVFTPRKREAVTALDGVSLSIPVGEVHGLLGPNGAGKTTLVKILSTVLLPTGGQAFVSGHDVVTETRAVRPLIGIVFGGERGLYTRLSARQNLEYWGALYRLSGSQIKARSAELLERVGLTERADQRVEEFSRGMKQRLHLARGLMGDARVLFLDEPTTGMDPLAAREFRTLIGELKGEGRTILLTTHDMVEAETVCDRVTLIDRGRILATETPRTLGSLISRFQRIDVEGASEALIADIELLTGVSAVAVQPDGSVRIEVMEDGATTVVLKQLVDAGVTSVKTSLPSLEEVYVQMIGERGLTV